MDMITQIEVQDALAQRDKVDKRVLEVAKYIGELANELSHRPITSWRLSKFYMSPIHYRPEGDKLMISAYLEVPWHDRPITERYGDPVDDESDFGLPTNLERVVSFPARYLWTDGWQEEAIKNAQEAAKRWAEIQVKNLEEALVNHDNRRKELEAKLQDFKKRAL